MSDLNSLTAGTPIPQKKRAASIKNRVKVPKTEMEHHKGWIENLKNEERTMKESINNCIDKGLTKNALRA